MLVKVLISALLVSVILSTVPLPYSEEGRVIVPVGGEWTYNMELETQAHVTCIVHSSVPVDIVLTKNGEANDADEPPISVAKGTTDYRPTENLGQGKYRLVVTNPGLEEAIIYYQVHQDFIVVANMTAKNVMALSLALSMGIVALFLYSRPRRP